MTKDKKPKRRTTKLLPMPEPIPETPERIASVFMKSPPKKKWRYLEGGGKKEGSISK